MKTVDRRETPRYGVTEAARYIGGPLHPATLRSWVAGRPYRTLDGPASSEPLIRIPNPDARPVRLSFTNLIEAYVLKELRRWHEVPMSSIREAIATAAADLGVERLLIRKDLQTDGKDLFIRHLGELVRLSRSNQFQIEEVLQATLRRVVYGSDSIAIRWFPKGLGTADKQVVAIDPRYVSGRPFVARTGVSVGVLAERLDQGESVEELAEDYDLEPDEVRAALTYANAA